MKNCIYFLLFPLLLGCSEPEDITNRAFLLTGENSKSWQLTTINVNGGADKIPLDCESDDVETFHANNSYIYSHGNKSCSNQGNKNGKWNLNDDFITLDINYNDDSYLPNQFKIVHLDESKLVLEQIVFDKVLLTYLLVD